MATIEFVNYDHHYYLSTEDVEDAVRELQPGVIQSLAVFISDRWWPVKQPFVQALARKGGNIKDNTDVNSRTALRHLARLGFPTHDSATQGPLPAAPGAPVGSRSVEDRRLALSLAVELLKGKSVSASDVTGLADQLSSWLG
jgi:hypothetical protein